MYCIVMDTFEKLRRKPIVVGYKLVIQFHGSHMVSGYRCPAGNDQTEKRSVSTEAALKGKFPMEHRGDFPDVLRATDYG